VLWQPNYSSPNLDVLSSPSCLLVLDVSFSLTPELQQALEDGKKRYTELQRELMSCAEEEEKYGTRKAGSSSYFSDDVEETETERKARCCWKNSRAQMQMIQTACRNLTLFNEARARVAGLSLLLASPLLLTSVAVQWSLQTVSSQSLD